MAGREHQQVSRTQMAPNFEGHVGYSVQLNDEACFSLICGKNEQAIAKCKKALGILKQGLVSMDSNEDVCLFRHQKRGGGPGGNIRELEAEVNPPELRIDTSPSLARRASEGLSFVYTNAFRFRPSRGESLMVDVDLICAVVIFNMALSYHTYIPLYECTNLHESSLQLYELCLSLLERQSQDFLECRVLRSVCFNNMAHLSYENGNFSDSRDLLDDLMQSLNQDGSLCAFFHEGEVQGFVLNYMLLHAPNTARAA